MSSRIIIYGLAGVWWGSLFSILHLITTVTDQTGPKLLLANLGLTASTGGLAGLGVGFLLSFIPPQLRMMEMFGRLKTRLFPDESKALQYRSRSAATCWTLLLFLAYTLRVLAWLFGAILKRIQEPLFGAAAITLVGILVITLSLGLAGVFRSTLSRVIEALVRRFPSLSPLCNPFGNLLTAIVLIGLSLGIWLNEQHHLERHALINYLAPFGLILCIAISGDFLESLLARVSVRRARIVFLGSMFFFMIAGVASIRSTTIQDTLAEGAGIPALVLKALQQPFDEDGDGFAPILGGRDCNDENPQIHPGAMEIYGNEIDENCDGVLVAELRPSDESPNKPNTTIIPPGPLNIVLITISNLRPDHLSFFGYQHETTPNLDAFASGSVYFTQAYTPSPTLSYGLASLLSGQFASEMARTQENWPRFLENNPWITKILRQRGYATAAFLSHWYFSEGSGLDDGFAIWQPRVAEKGRTKTVASSELVFERARNFLQAAPTDRPFFLWAHTIDPREEYLEHMGIPRFGRDVVAQYDHELRYVDEMLAPLFKTLRERTDWNKTIVVLTSEQGHDFGESYRDEGLMPLSQVQQKVPLFIRIPGVRPRPINHPVSLTRIFPTLSEVSNANRKAIPVNEARLSLLRLLDEDNERKTPILSELLTNRTDRFSLSFIEDNMKLHYDGNERRWRLFDLKADPSERDDQYAVRPKLAHKLRKSLARYRSNMNLVAPK